MKHFLFLLASLCFSIFANAQNHSELSEGSWVKISTNRTGIYALTYEDLQEMGVDVTNLNSDNLNLYGLPAGVLNEVYSPDFTYDLQKIAITVVDGDDGTFDPGDYIMFYGQGPVTWDYNVEKGDYNHYTNPYCSNIYYYLRTDDTNPKRMETIDFNNNNATDTITQITQLMLHEKELYNLLHSGRVWLGEKFRDTLERTFDFTPSSIKIKSGTLKISVASTATDQSSFDVYINNNWIKKIKVNACPSYVAYRLSSEQIELPNDLDELNVKMVYNPPNDSAVGYLNYCEVILNTGMMIAGDQMMFTNKGNGGENLYHYEMIDADEQDNIWDITTPENTYNIATQYSNGRLEFNDTLANRQFIVFNTGNLLQPALEGSLQNEDLIGTTPANYVIIYNGKTTGMMEAATDLGDFHKDIDNLTYEVVDVNSIYNEFSAGRTDPTALRNFIAYRFNQSEGNEENQLKEILLLGPASFDYRGILYPGIKQVPTYEMEESANIVNSYAYDGYIISIGDVVFPIGRIPASTAEEAQIVIQKIKDYTSASRFTAWKNRLILMADDGDYGLFGYDSDTYCDTILASDKNFNQNKLYFSLYPKIDGAYPQVKQKLLNELADGIFYVNYTGHGGSNGLSSEAVFTTEDAKNLTNNNLLPLWVNSSGSTSRFDDPEIESINRALLFNPQGGAIAAIGNSGANYASQNRAMNRAFVEYFFDKNNRSQSFGYAFVVATAGVNSYRRMWTFFGDPALKPVWPKYTVQTTQINGVDAGMFTDTIHPGSMLKIKGFIADNDGNQVSDFNGTVNVTIYDMPYTKETIEGEYDPVREITLYDSVLTINNIDIMNGNFEGEIRLPAKYHEQYGNIKLSYYGNSETKDASGSWGKIMYGGSVQGIDEDPALASLKVYPTLFEQNIKIEIPVEAANKHLQMTLTDITGRPVYKQRISSSQSGSILSVNLPALSHGMYLLNISGTKGGKVFKLLRE